MRRLLCLCILLASTYVLAQTNPTPFLNQPLSPMSAAPGGSRFVLTIDGTNFVAGSVVHWNGVALTTTFVNSSQLTATVPATDVAHAGTASISVVNPAPGGGLSNLLTFDISNPVSSLNFSDFFDTTFQLPTINQAPDVAASMMTADFNSDGNIDLAEIDNSHTLAIQLGNGDGSFQTAFSTSVDAMNCTLTPSFVVADFNGDGKLDIAIPNCGSSEISILLGNGDGTFQRPVTYPADPGVSLMVVGDFNGDGKLDIATLNSDVNNNGPAVSVFLGNGDGTFQNHVDYGIASNLVGIAIGDFDSNGTLDLLFMDDEFEVWMLPGNGDGTFSSPRQLNLAFSTPPDFIFSNTASILAADVNGDHKLDLIITLNAKVSGLGIQRELFAIIYPGNGDGTFQSDTLIQLPIPTLPPPLLEPTNPFVGIVSAGDLNADDKLDLVFQNSGLAVTVLPGNGDGTFQSAMNFVTFTDCTTGGAFPVIGDFNGDGAVDLAVANSACYLGDPNLAVLLQGSFPTALALPSALTFTNQQIGTSASQTVTISNSGTALLSISALSLAGTNAGDFSQTNSCGATLPAKASCTATVTFTPAAGGTRTATLSFSNNGPGGVRTISLTGNASSFLSPSSVNFPNQYVGTSGLPQTVTLTNTNTTNPISITSVTASPGDFAVISGCGSSVPANSSCSIGVFFDPTISGTRTGTLTVTDNAAGSPQTVSLSGVGQDFSMAPSSASATVSAGQTAQYTVSVSPAGSFNQTVTLNCSGAPAQSTCLISPSSVQLNGTSSTPVTVTVRTSGSSANLKYPRGTNLRLALWLATFGVPGFVLLGGGWKRRTRGKRSRGFYVLVVLFLLAMPFTWSGCGGGSSGGNGNGGGGSISTPAGSYNFSVTGNFTSGSTNLTHTTQLTLVVQ